MKPVKLKYMLVKVPVYFKIEVDKNAKITDVSLYTDRIRTELESYLKDGSTIKLEGSLWNENRIKAKFVTSSEALESLRTGK